MVPQSTAFFQAKRKPNNLDRFDMGVTMYRYEGLGLGFRGWLVTPVGAGLVALEGLRVGEMVSRLFGYEAVLCGDMRFMVGLDASPIRNRVLLSDGVDSIGGGSMGVCTRYDKLPLGGEYVDLVYLAHCLEVANNPHEVLREAYRILRPDGRLVISMLNPFGLWGVWRSVARLGVGVPWRANFISLVKLRDWLALLGFDIIRVCHFGYGLPYGRSGLVADGGGLSGYEAALQRMNFPGGAVYVVEASKRVMPVTPIRPQWREEVVVEDVSESPV